MSVVGGPRWDSIKFTVYFVWEKGKHSKFKAKNVQTRVVVVFVVLIVIYNKPGVILNVSYIYFVILEQIFH